MRCVTGTNGPWHTDGIDPGDHASMSRISTRMDHGVVPVRDGTTEPTAPPDEYAPA